MKTVLYSETSETSETSENEKGGRADQFHSQAEPGNEKGCQMKLAIGVGRAGRAKAQLQTF
jgi:hypothetical protein